MTNITDEQLAEWKRMADAATTGPWKIEVGKYSGDNWLVGSLWLGTSIDDSDYWIHITTDHVRASRLAGDAKTDAEFIAAAREAMPALLAEVDHLRAATGERDALRKAIDAAIDAMENHDWLERESKCTTLLASDADKLRDALAAVPMPPQADDRLLAVAERAARAMQHECSALMWDDNDKRTIRAIDVPAIARRAVEEQEKP